MQVTERNTDGLSVVAQNNPVAIAATELVGNVAVTAALQSFVRG